MPPRRKSVADSVHGLTHVDHRGQARMVDVSRKPPTTRTAVAEAVVRLDRPTQQALFAGALPKGDALAVARIAGIQAAKDAARLLPLCHPLPLTHVAVDVSPLGDDAVRIETSAATVAGTGVEMEAMTAAAVAALALYDLVKSRCRGACIERVRLRRKLGGRSGVWEAPR